MELAAAIIRPSYNEAKRRGASHLLVFHNTRSKGLEIVYVMPAQDPDRVAANFDSPTVQFVQSFAIDQDFESQLSG